MTGVKYRRNEFSMEITTIPERKKPVLMLSMNNQRYVVASIRDAECAEALVVMLDYLTTGDGKAEDKISEILFNWSDT